MKRFLLSNHGNEKWVEAQEKRHKSERGAQRAARLVRREMYPALRPETVGLGLAGAPCCAPPGVAIEARQRQLHRALMKELLSYFSTQTKGKQTVAHYRTMAWAQKSKAIFFYFHKSLGNRDAELTCSVFSINFMTFQNWIKQKRYFGKWAQYVKAYTRSRKATRPGRLPLILALAVNTKSTAKTSYLGSNRLSKM